MKFKILPIALSASLAFTLATFAEVPASVVPLLRPFVDLPVMLPATVD